jgi:tryptophan-rich sensory protein
MSDQDRLASILLIPLLLFVAASTALVWSRYEYDMRAAEARTP